MAKLFSVVVKSYYSHTAKPISNAKFHNDKYSVQFEYVDGDDEGFRDYYLKHAKEYEGRKLLALYSKYPFRVCNSKSVVKDSDEIGNIGNGELLTLLIRPYTNNYGSFYSVAGIIVEEFGAGDVFTEYAKAKNDYVNIPDGVELPFN